MFTKDDDKESIRANKYQLLLPSQDSTYSFIVHKNHLGIYDNLNNRELLLKDQVSSIKISPIDFYSSYIDLLVEGDDGQLAIAETYIISKAKDKSNKLSIHEKGSEERKSLWFSGHYYENDVRLIDTDQVIHNFALIEPENDSLIIVQRSGVYSLKEKRFVIPQEYIKIEANYSPSYDKNASLFLISLSIEENEYLHQIEQVYDKEGGYLFELPQENFRYGLYDSEMHEIIKPNNIDIYPLQFGGFYSNETLYDAAGQKLIMKHYIDISRDKEGVFLSKNYVINREYRKDLYHEDETAWSFYKKDGQFVEMKSFEIVKFLALSKQALGIIQKYDKEFEWLTNQGVFDFDENIMVIPAVYNEITIIENGDDYYFSCQEKENIVYFNKDFKEFTP